MSIHFANCCNPIPGDDVVAFILKGKGLIIHQISCDELKNQRSDKSKKVKVSWENLLTKRNEFVGKLNVTIKNKIGSLGVLSSIIAKSLSNIRNLKITDRNSDFFKLTLCVIRFDNRTGYYIIASEPFERKYISKKRVIIFQFVLFHVDLQVMPIIFHFEFGKTSRLQVAHPDGPD